MLKAEEPQWPPRSPREALLGSPSGRNKLRELQDRLSKSPSVSPMKKSTSMPSFHERARRLNNMDAPIEEGQEDEEDDDEETLQLQLQAIETKLKLKRLREAKAKGVISDPDSEGRLQKVGAQLPRSRSVATLRSDRARRPQASTYVEVPSSPQKKATVVAEPKSPGRVLLGIDKGFTGRDVSLRRAPSLKNNRSTNEDPFASRQARDTAFEKPVLQPNSGRPAAETNLRKSFSERMAEMRAGDRSKEESSKQRQITKSRGFGVDRSEIDRLTKLQATTIPSIESRSNSATGGSSHEFTRDQIMASSAAPVGKLLCRSKTTTDMSALSHRAPQESPKPSTLSQPPSSSFSTQSQMPAAPEPPLSSVAPIATVADPSLFESISSLHLSKRHLPHTFISRTILGKKVFLIPDLLRIIKAPDYDAPEVNEDFVVFGIVASKSQPKAHMSTHQTSTEGKKDEKGRGKYMVITLTDLKWELELFLFGTGFDRFWKLTPGALIAILNPSIMPPPSHKRDTGKFSLTLNSSDDTVLEIGTARDLGFCKSIKKDGKSCDQWVDKRHTEFCDFHVDLRLRKTQASRMEVNTMAGPFAPGGRSGSRTGFWGGRRGGYKAKDDGLRQEGPYHDRETNTQVYIGHRIPGAGRSSASLLDDDDVDPDAFHRGTNKGERLRRRLAEREREREIGRKLGAAGNGPGGEYLLAHHNAGSSESNGNTDSKSASQETVDAASFGLLGVKASEVHLSPVKRKRQSSTEAVGWSSAFKRGLPAPTKDKNNTKDVEGGSIGSGASQAPHRKKTRFITSKGIREAGRESLGTASGPNDEDDDDELDIV